MSNKPQRSSYSGRTRVRKTQPAVRMANRIAAAVITVGGISTVLAVTLVCVFLFSVAVPIFFPPSVEKAVVQEKPVELAEADLPPAHFAVNEYRTMAWVVTRRGELLLIHLRDGQMLRREALFGERVPTDIAVLDQTVAAGFADGSIQYGEVTFDTEYVTTEDLPEDLRAGAESGVSMAYEGGVLEPVAEDRFRVQRLTVALKDPVMIEAGAPVHALDVSIKNTGPVFAVLTEPGTLHLKEVSIRRNMVTRKETITLYGGRITLPTGDGEGLPRWLGLTGLGDNVLLVRENGGLLRVDARNIEEPALVQNVRLLDDGAKRVDSIEFLIGKTSLLVGDDRGHLDIWFRVRPEGLGNGDGSKLVRAHRLERMDAPVRAMAVSARTRMLAAADRDGALAVHYATNRRLLARMPPVGGGRDGVYALALSPKDDALYAWTRDGLYSWELDIPHPEINFRQVFGKIWYEGYNEPAHIWQSSSGTDDFEPKYGLAPLVFGTIKATFYSLLFGVPLAILAAVYSSEIMSPRVRARVKPTIEMMASLPSVVLGFLSAIVIAPLVENSVAQMLVGFVTIPFALLLGAHLWQLLPQQGAHRLRFLKLPLMLAFAVLGFRLCGPVGRFVETTLFLGDIKRWLSTNDGSAVGGWMVLMAPLCGIATMWVNSVHLTPRLRKAFERRGRLAYVLVDLVRFLASCVFAVGLAWGISALLSLLGDARGNYLDTYVQRNALIVGFVMGFAIIPIIYTLCEDAMSSVPEALRAASLGAGATPWQTATRIVIPTAASGFFSAVMIGFGRAVGETMIVLMAAGNTAVMEWNVFNGFRTLSANIAVELPEAVRGSSHYRMLFLAALCLFAMTFTLNSVAEVVRQRFRKRAFEL